ncbi:proline/glycine betaine ABC transporter permease [Alcaligenes ammonioxydans]|jgi:glycine betaine/proline transport system permease protein|uniref:Proline/glycine betaine ABC transporter permease n=1 Tax=Alcaligenes ammonioxydans TaxID=2582914 RepID=A0ABX8SUD3_9BURK|nr:proline/glycine betaine ABC transporter permease [Alcaligenes ammonioxydans]EJC62362.1 binding-protein-dependent transport protein [Alcaligenes faecalis subsp. faecalis NCIB 8687]QBH18485.1 proline/glycine betaine ABC transporter permease [Alcaligenes faecalis]MCH1880812.1 proline/glycine betaine ABC transporter permease [Alcaligenes ammonioxydans]QXX79638.1 proline/glycine betaine ABC transporter permease [Alcaligenes ammonioxydans]WGQ34574.1 proline/glycine betaine ABC transporter permeas
MFPELIDPRALRLPIDQFVGDLVANYSSTLRAMTQPLLDMLVFMESVLRSSPWWAVVLVVVLLGWLASRRVLFSVAMGAMLFVIGLIGLWDAAMQTLALMIVAVFLSVLIGIPLGLLMASFNWLRRIMMPVLDVMQTMPSFVYLIPVVMLFNLGKIAALIATIIYAIAPVIRLTDLGIRLVDSEVLEASRSFGSNRWQQLYGVQLPLAMPNIMAGINQTTMMALAMVVIASMIGVRGLGYEVLQGINRLQVGRGLMAGLGIVLLAILFDRITQEFGRRFQTREAS